MEMKMKTLLQLSWIESIFVTAAKVFGLVPEDFSPNSFEEMRSYLYANPVNPDSPNHWSTQDNLLALSRRVENGCLEITLDTVRKILFITFRLQQGSRERKLRGFIAVNEEGIYDISPLVNHGCMPEETMRQSVLAQAAIVAHILDRENLLRECLEAASGEFAETWRNLIREASLNQFAKQE